MPSLTEKLKQLGVQVGTSQIQSPANNSGVPRSLVDVLAGQWESTTRGDCFVVRKEIPAHTSHGMINLSGPPDLAFFESLQQLEGISGISPEDFLFIDTETTGLSGGAGTYVFLIGAAKYINDSLDFAQFFLQDPGSESAQLAALESFAASTQIVISYNGKSFDLPRIKTRYQYHGWPNPFENVFHIDLLHFARRIWKAQLPSCTLGDLEKNILGLERHSLDIPGYKVSEYFYQYLHTQDPAPLENIFYHNEIDVISLAALLVHLTDRLSSPMKHYNLLENNPELIDIAKYYYSIQLYQEAKEVLDAALTDPGFPDDILLDGKLCLASIYKKSGDFSSAAPIWEECAEMGSFEALIELAKHAEHNLSDFENAVHWTLSAIELLDTLPAEKHASLSGQLDHRLQRLKLKAKR